MPSAYWIIAATATRSDGSPMFHVELRVSSSRRYAALTNPRLQSIAATRPSRRRPIRMQCGHHQLQRLRRTLSSNSTQAARRPAPPPDHRAAASAGRRILRQQLELSNKQRRGEQLLLPPGDAILYRRSSRRMQAPRAAVPLRGRLAPDPARQLRSSASANSDHCAASPRDIPSSSSRPSRLAPRPALAQSACDARGSPARTRKLAR